MKKAHSSQKVSRAPRLRGWKRWAFPLAAMILVPGLFFVLLEMGLRFANYGFPTEFLIKREVMGEAVYTDNRQYGWRFFPAQVARRPADIVIPAAKATTAFRVVVLGESAAMGDPDNAFGIPRMLEMMLSERFPSIQFEVVNAAMTGISSHIIQDIARDCARVQPDCFVVYMGNNEAIGPYGPGTVFASFSRYLALTRLSIDARSLRTSQMMDALIRSRSKSGQPDGWGGLRVFMKSQFHPTDQKLAVLAEHFEANLKTICETGHKAGAKLVLCTVASNLKDCSPFASLNSPSLSLEQKNQWESRWTTANKLEADGKKEEALKVYQEAEVIDSSYAELHFRMGQLYTVLQRPKEASESFLKARDCDALKFRTSSDLNARVKKMVESYSSEAVLADVVKAVDEESASAGGEHFVDHVHFTFHGNYVAAREIFNAVSRFVPASAQKQQDKPVELTEQQCVERLAYSRWNQGQIAQHMLKRLKIPPFDSKSDFSQRMRELEAKVVELQDAASPKALQEAIEMHQQVLQRRKSDPESLRCLAELYSEMDQPVEEQKYRQKLYELFPYDLDRRAFLADAYVRAGNYADGEKFARDVLKTDSTHVIARLALGALYDRKGELDAASAEYAKVIQWRPDLSEPRRRLDEVLKRKNRPFEGVIELAGAQRLSPEESQKCLQRGQTLLQEGRIEEAVKELQTAVRFDPSLAEGYVALGGAMVQLGKVEEGIEQCKKALRVRPNFVTAHTELGGLLTDLGRLAEARTHLDEAIRLEPENADAQLSLGLNLLRENRPKEALGHLEIFVRKNSDRPEAHRQIGVVYENTGEWSKAISSYREALRLQPEDQEAQASLAWVLATSPQSDVRDGKEAVRLAEAACNAGKKQTHHVDILAAAFAENSRFSEAIKSAEEAVALARAANETQYIQDIQKRLALYQSNKPFRVELAAPGTTVSAKATP